MIVPGRVQDEVPQELAGSGLDDPDVEVVDEQDHGGSGVGSPDADVVEPTLDAQGDAAGVVDPVPAYPVVGLFDTGPWCRLRAGAIGHRRGAGLGEGPVGPAVVVVVDEDVDESLKLADGGRLAGLGPEPFLHRLSVIT